MRLSLTAEARAHLEALQEQCAKINPSIEPATSTFLIRLLSVLPGVLSAEQVHELANSLTSERVKRKRIVERLIKLGDALDESDIEKFEHKVAKKRAASSVACDVKTAENC